MKSFDSVSAKAIVLMKVYIKSRTEVIKKIEKFDRIGDSNFAASLEITFIYIIRIPIYGSICESDVKFAPPHSVLHIHNVL